MKKKLKKRKTLPLQPCKGCGTHYIPKSRRQKYHNEDCRVAYYKKHYFGVQEVTKVCPNCDNPFTTTMAKKQTYCKPACRKEAARKRIDEVVARYDAEHATYLGERFAAFKRDDFRCTVCGKGAKEGAVLDVEDDGTGGLRTICGECKTGKEVAG